MEVRNNMQSPNFGMALKIKCSPKDLEAAGAKVIERLGKAGEELADKIDAKYDVIAANIVADVLIAMKDYFLRYVKSSGTLIVSGIIEERMHEVIGELESVGFKDPQINVKEGWAAVGFTAPV